MVVCEPTNTSNLVYGFGVLRFFAHLADQKTTSQVGFQLMTTLDDKGLSQPLVIMMAVNLVTAACQRMHTGNVGPKRVTRIW